MKTFQEFVAEAYVKKSEVSGHVNVSRGAVPAKATDASIKGAVTRALANPGQAQSASSETGRMKTTVSGGINVTGTVSTGSKPKPKNLKPEPESETRKPREVVQGGRKPREVTQPGSGTPQKGTKIYVKDGKGIRQTSFRDMSPEARRGILPHLTGGKGMPTAVIRNVSPNRRPTVDKIYQSSEGPTPLNQATRRQSSTGRAPRQVSQQPSSLGRRSLGGF